VSVVRPNAPPWTYIQTYAAFGLVLSALVSSSLPRLHFQFCGLRAVEYSTAELSAF